MTTVLQSPTTLPPTPTRNGDPPNTFSNDPDGDIILRSCCLQEFRVLKLFIIKNSPVLGKRIQTICNSLQPVIPDDSETPLPVVQMSENGAILSTLLTFIFPTTTVLPSTLEETMKLLSVAQWYEMASTLSHIRGCIALKDPPLISPENAFHAYSLAQRYGHHQEAFQAARLTLTFTLAIEKLDDKLDLMPGSYLYELWKYHKRVQSNLSSDVDEFIESTAHGSLSSLKCVELSPRGIPRWLDRYISSIATTPSFFDLIELQVALARHVKAVGISFQGSKIKGCTSCSRIPSRTIRTFWTTLTTFFNENVAKAESSLSILGSECETRSEGHTHHSAAIQPLPEYLPVSEGDIIIQSSDLVDFRVHKAILASSSQFFRTMFSLPQPPNKPVNESDIPVIRVSEDAEIIRALITVLYPVPSEIPVTYDRVLALLAASQKYDMPAVQFSIRTEVSYRKLAAQSGKEAFRAYAIARRNGLSPETSTAARLTLDYPLTFESIGNELREFQGGALRDLVTFRKLRRDDVVSCFKSFRDIRTGPSRIWIGCPKSKDQATNDEPILPVWLDELFRAEIEKLEDNFTDEPIRPSCIRKDYLAAIRIHTADCRFCMGVHTRQGEEYCVELERKLARALDNVFESGDNESSAESESVG